VSRRRTAGTARTKLLTVLGVLGVAAAVTAVASATGSPPAPSISSSPANPTNATSASFTYTDSAAITKFQCKLDSGSFADCGTTRPSTKTYSGLAAGSHTFQVKAVSGSETSSATSSTWVIDLSAPTVVSINRIGGSPTNAGSVQWTVTFNEAVKGVDASDLSLVNGGLGGSPAITGVTPNASTLSTTFTVTASTGTGSGTLGLNLVDNDSIVDAAANKLGGTGAGNGNFTGLAYTIDRAAPAAPGIGPVPAASPAWTTSTTVNFTFTGEAGATFQCKLDAGSLGACSSPKSYSGLSQGSHAFQVQQTDSPGNTGPSAARTFQIDSIAPPAPSITSKPANPTNSTAANFVFSDSEGGVTFLCQLDGGGFTACSSPKNYAGPLSPGSHTFQVQARDAAGNTSPSASWTWLIDTTPPNAPSIFLGPLPQPPFGWPVTWALFAFASSSSDVASYECRFDGGAFSTCSSPKTYSGLADGLHTFQVRAIDEAGNISGLSVLWQFLVDTVPPTQPVLTQTPPSSTSSTSATLDWTSSDPAPASGVAAHLCKLDDGWWLLCSKPKTYTSLALGSHTFSVVAIDWAANVSQVATYTWTVSDNTGQPFTIHGDADGLLYPGTWRYIALRITNPNAVDIFVTALTVNVTNDPGGCPNAVNVEVQQSSVAPTVNELQVPAGATDWSVPQAFQPRIRLAETGANQDNCQGDQFNLSYSGSAHS